MRYFCRITPLVLLLFCFSTAPAQTETSQEVDTALTGMPPPAPVTNLHAVDTDDDHGHSITLEWELSVDDGAGQNSVVSYEIFRWVPTEMDMLDTLRSQLSSISSEIRRADHVTSEMKHTRALLQTRFRELLGKMPELHVRYPEKGVWRQVGKVGSQSTSYVNSGSKDSESPSYIPDYTDYYYRVDAVTADSSVRAASEIIGPVQSFGQWFNTGRYPVLFAVLIFGFLTISFVAKAKKGAELFVRPLAGIEEVDEAIGRATEMGKPILYVLGLGTADMIATIASFTILGRVAKRVAEYQTRLIVPTYDPIVMSVAQEVVKSAYLDAGRADTYNEDIVFFVTQAQFAYVAAVNGIMLRELPATNVYMGKFYAESLILAETGALAGSIQIAGTDEIAQIPFFIVACDYTLIGEELYAASAYLGREPILLGSLKAQDYAKAAVIILALVGLVAANFGWTTFTDLFRVAN